MADNYNSGAFFESQKGISDRHAARGFPPGHNGADGSGGSTRGGDAAGGGNLIATMIFGVLVLMWKIAEVVIPILLRLIWEVTKLAGQMLVAIMSRGKGR